MKCDPFEAARKKGRDAAHARKPRESNPYADLRTHRGACTWSRAWHKEWLVGYDQVRDRLVKNGTWMTGFTAGLIAKGRRREVWVEDIEGELLRRGSIVE